MPTSATPHVLALEAARRDGITCAANVIREQLANKLAVIIGYSEALAEDEDQPVIVRQRAYMMLASALAAGDVLQTLEWRVISSGNAGDAACQEPSPSKY